MKKLNVILLALAFVVSSFSYANNAPKTVTNDLTKEIKTLLKKTTFNVEKESTAFVTFTLNANKEIVVLTVDSENKSVERFIKSRLNYQKVVSSLDENVKFYKIPVRVVEN